MSAENNFSQQVAWWPVHEFVAPVLARIGSWPMVGTPEWCALPDDDRRKIAAVFDAARHWALRVDMSQEARAEASKAISAATDWTTVGRGRGDAYIPREVAA